MDVVQDFYQVLDWQQQSQSLLQYPLYALILLTLIFVLGYGKLQVLPHTDIHGNSSDLVLGQEDS